MPENTDYEVLTLHLVAVTQERTLLDAAIREVPCDLPSSKARDVPPIYVVTHARDCKCGRVDNCKKSRDANRAPDSIFPNHANCATNRNRNKRRSRVRHYAQQYCRDHRRGSRGLFPTTGCWPITEPRAERRQHEAPDSHSAQRGIPTIDSAARSHHGFEG